MSKINENSAAGGSMSGAGAAPIGSKRPNKRKKPSKNVGSPFNNPINEENTVVPVKMLDVGVVIPKSKKEKKKAQERDGGGNEPDYIPVAFNPKAVKNMNQSKNNTRLVVRENKSERALRESIRNIVFLSRVKYHEENAKREIEEQKLRKVIRYLLTEEAKTNQGNSTGERAASSFLKSMTVTINQSYGDLKSMKAQRDRFFKIYKTALINALDMEDHAKRISIAAAQRTKTTPASNQDMESGFEAGKMAAKRGDGMMDEADPLPPAPIPDPTTPATNTDVETPPIDDKAIAKQAFQAAITANPAEDDDTKVGDEAALQAFNRDTGTAIGLYRPLGWYDREQFRINLFGVSPEGGNLESRFEDINRRDPPADAGEAPADATKRPGGSSLADPSRPIKNPTAPTPDGAVAAPGLEAGVANTDEEAAPVAKRRDKVIPKM